jgi:hypothetical protein
MPENTRTMPAMKPPVPQRKVSTDSGFRRALRSAPPHEASIRLHPSVEEETPTVRGDLPDLDLGDDGPTRPLSTAELGALFSPVGDDDVTRQFMRDSIPLPIREDTVSAVLSDVLNSVRPQAGSPVTSASSEFEADPSDSTVPPPPELKTPERQINAWTEPTPSVMPTTTSISKADVLFTSSSISHSFRASLPPSVRPRPRRFDAAPTWALLVVAAIAGAVASPLALRGLSRTNPGIIEWITVGEAQSAAAPAANPAVGTQPEPLKTPANAAPALHEDPLPRSDGKLTVAHVMALNAGRANRAKIALASLKQAVERQSQITTDSPELQQLLTFIEDADTAQDAIGILATLPGPVSADLLYDVATSSRKSNAATHLATMLLDTEEVRSKASPALRATLDIRRAASCEDFAQVLPAAIEHADRRALKALRGIAQRDCSRSIDDSTARAITAAARRRAPSL